jgi:hypothetical protein
MMAEMKQAAAPEKRSYRRLVGMHIRKVASGFTVTHEHQSNGMALHMPKEHAFGKGEGSKVKAHVNQYLKAMGAGETDGTEASTSKAESLDS